MRSSLRPAVMEQVNVSYPNTVTKDIGDTVALFAKIAGYVLQNANEHDIIIPKAIFEDITRDVKKLLIPLLFYVLITTLYVFIPN